MALGAASNEQRELLVPLSKAAIGAPPQIVPKRYEFRLAIQDMIEGACSWRMWGLLGWLDIRQRYRRSKIGPLWITISMGAMIAGIGYFYPTLLHASIPRYLPFLSLGFIVWALLSGIVNDDCLAFIGAESIIKQIKLPLTLHVLRVVWRNLILFAHNMIIYVLVATYFGVWPGWSLLLLIPGLVLVCLNGVSMGLLLGSVSARFRDVPQIVVSILQVFFFLTPIFWQPETLSRQSWLLDLNPFYYFLEVVRGPLLGEPLSAQIWLVAIVLTVCGWLAAFLMYSQVRRRIAYWL